MTRYSKFNIVYRLQKWMDSVPGQTFLNYAYSWGAAIVILGTLFKLTHIPGANFWLFLGMGTEVVVFFLSAFDRPFDKTTDGMELDTHVRTGLDAVAPAAIGESTEVAGEAIEHVGQKAAAVAATSGPSVVGTTAGGGGATVVGGTGGTIIIGGGGSTVTGTPIQETVDTEAIAAVASSVATVSATAETPEGGGATSAAAALGIPTVNPELEEATANYVDELKRLTEMLSKVATQSERLARDSEEMENLNRTLTGICKVYELQLKSASSQIGTIDEINEQTKKMAEQIEQLNNIYARMIEAMTMKMKAE